MSQPGRAVCLAVTIVLLYSPTTSAQAPGGGVRLTGSVAAGFDSFQEKYSIVDRDTLDSVNEFRTQVTLGVLAGQLLREFFLAEGRVQYGDDTYETSGHLKLNQVLWSGSTRLGLDAFYTRKTFGTGSSFQFPNDFQRTFFRGYFKRSFGPIFAVRVTDRLEVQDFQRRTDYDYDYRRNRLSLGGEFDWNLSSLLDMRVTHAVMVVPDSTEINYQAFVPSVEFRHLGGLNDRVTVRTAFERRDYVAGSPRSSYWAVLGSLAGERSITVPMSVLLESDTEWYSYDFKDPVYFDYLENRSALQLKFNHNLDFSIGAGPTVGFLASDVSGQDEYTEVGAKISLEYNRGARAWIAAAYEPGKRSYRAFEPTDTYAFVERLPLFSDYTYHRFSLFLNARLVGALSVGGYVDYQPEDHTREGDDATATLVSLSLTATF